MSLNPQDSHEPTTAIADESAKTSQTTGLFSKPILKDVAPQSNTQNILHFLISLRILNALVVQTFFQPDEYFQALEPAWHWAFGTDSAAWITWEWKNYLRSAIHPALFAIAYSLAEGVANISNVSPTRRAELLFVTPQILQALIAALGDYYTWKLAEHVYGMKSTRAWTVLILTVVSPWQWFCSVRTFSNCLETTLTIMALYNWPWHWSTPPGRTEKSQVDEYGLRIRSVNEVEQGKVDEITRLRRALLLAAVATILRPTNILIWITLEWLAFVDLRTCSFIPSSRECLAFIRESVICGTVVMILSTLVDRLFYRTWTLPSLNFIKFNVLQSISVFYGHNDWHYYITQGYTLLLTTALPFALISMYQVLTMSKATEGHSSTSQVILRQLAIVSIAVPAFFSILSHKEVRFIYPLLPALHVLAGGPLADFLGPSILQRATHPKLKPPYRITKRILLGILLALNLSIALYTTTIHNSGLITVTHYLRHQFEDHYLHSATPKNMTVGFLMPCHSTPWRSHIQYPPTSNGTGIAAWALTCEPPLNLSPAEKETYLDEADIFYQNPTIWIKKNMSRHPPLSFKSRTGFFAANDRRHGIETNIDDGEGKRRWPEYLVFFQALESFISTTLRGSGYAECARFFNSHWHDDRRRTGDVILWCLYPERKSLKRTRAEKLEEWKNGMIGQFEYVKGHVTNLSKALFGSADDDTNEYVEPVDLSVEKLYRRTQLKPNSRRVKKQWWHCIPGLRPKKRKNAWW